MKHLFRVGFLTILLSGVAAADVDPAVLEADPAVLEADPAVLKADPAVLEADPAILEVDPAVLKAEQHRIDVIDRAKDSVLAIFSADGGGGGSGVVISPDGYALTNFHVAKPSGTAMKCGLPDGELYDAVIVGVDPTGDVALIKLFGRDDFPHAEMADSDQVRAGDWAIVMGNPFLLATDFQPTVTYGIISGVHRYQFPAGTLLEYTDCIQTDASINPGNSGGPLFDALGRLIGINGRASFEKRGRVNVGVGYAISINQVQNFLGYLESGRIVDHATLGARVGFDDEGRVVVTNILESSDAYRRGLRYDDEIVSFGGRSIETPNGFKNALGIYPKGWRIPLSFRRDGRRFDVLVRLAGVHTPSELLGKTEGRPAHPMRPPAPRRLKPDGKRPDRSGDRDGDPDGDDSEPGELPVPMPEENPAPMPGDNPPAHGHRPEKPLPAVVQEHFEEKRGYSNYYFNRLHRQRVFDAWTAWGDFTSAGGAWTITGPLEPEGEFRFHLTDSEGSLEVPEIRWDWLATDSMAGVPTPPASGGLLPALHLWRRLAVRGAERFGEVYYLGTAPLLGQEERVDVLIGIHGGVECRFFFDSVDGLLVGMEMYPEEDVDPCEIYFSEYQETDGRHVPHRMEVRFGDEIFGVFQFEQFQFRSTK